MFQKIKSKFSFFVSLFLILTILVCQYRAIQIKNSKNPYPIAWDVYGYYLYLPATFIYNDLGLQNEKWIKETREKYNPSTTFYQVAPGINNKKVIIYSVGYSFIYAPGFFIANCFATSFGYEKDGFSKPYQLSLLYTALILSIIGIFMLRKIALHFFSDKITSFLLLIIVAGTNYFFQATYDGVMPHNILFTINAFIIWFTIKWHEQRTIKNMFLLCFFIGLATICRPTELIWIIVPLLWNVTNKASFLEKFNFLIKNYSQLLLFMDGLIVAFCIQLFYLKYATGNIFEVNLHSEGFSFFDPYTYQFLFSYKKGWLIYTPIMIFAIIGFYHLKKQIGNIWLALFLFFIINLYVVSSWECWWYAASFSQRPMVETYTMMVFPLGCFLNWIHNNSKKWIVVCLSAVLGILILLNMFQTWQYKNNIISPEQMTKQYYWKIFGKRKINEEDRKYLSVDRAQTTFKEYSNYNTNYFKKEIFSLDFEAENNQSPVDTTAVSGKKCFLLNSAIQFSPALEQEYYNITHKDYIWIRASVWVYLTAPYSESNSAIVISTENKGKPYKYLTSESNFNTKINSWTKIHLDFLTPDIRHKNDVIKIYFWNMGNKSVLIDDFKIDVFEPKTVFE